MNSISGGSLGMLDMDAYVSRNSYSSIKQKLFFYDKLYMHNFDSFEYAQLKTVHGTQRLYDQIVHLMDSGYLESVSLNFETPIVDNDIAIALRQLEIDYNEYISITQSPPKSNTSSQNFIGDSSELERLNKSFSFTKVLISSRERFYALLLSKKINQYVSPTFSLDTYNGATAEGRKTEIYKVLINQLPVPDDTVPFEDIIAYRNDEPNKLRFMRLRAWANNFSKSDYSEQEIKEEIEWLMAEYAKGLKLAKMGFRLSKIEFCVKVIPHVVEKLIKLNFSQLSDPFFKLAKDKVALLKDEEGVRGHELAYIVTAIDKFGN